MKTIYLNTLITLAVIAYFGLLGFAVYYLESGWPLLALLLDLKVKFVEDEKEEANC